MSTGLLPGQRRLYTPEGLDLRKLVPHEHRKDIPKYELLIHKIFEERIFNKRYNPNDFVQLKSTYLQNLFTSHKAKTIVSDLKDWGVIEVDEFYVRGVKSKGYRLSGQYRPQPVRCVILEDRLLLKKLSRFKTVYYDRANDVLSWLESNMGRLSINLEGAHSHILRKLTRRPPLLKAADPTQVAKLYSLLFSGKKAQKGPNREEGLEEGIVLKSNLSYVISFPDGRGENRGQKGVKQRKEKVLKIEPLGVRGVPYPFFVGDKSINFRVLVSDRAGFRGHAFYEQNRDYQARHFDADLLSIQYMHRGGPGEKFFIRDRVGNRLHTNLTNLRGELRSYLVLDSGEQLVNLDIKTSQPTLFNTLLAEYYRGKPWPKDAILYRDLTCDPDKDLYRHIMEQLGLPLTTQARSRFKKVFFGKIFYCDFKEGYRFEEQKVFEKYFPNVYRVLKHHKKPDFRNLPIEMQRRESRLIIDVVCAGLLRDHGKDFFCATIHDSILTAASNAGHVKVKMEEAFLSLYGFLPHITIEPVN